MNNLAFVHIVNENLGDASCCPKQHFPGFRDCPELDFRRVPEEMQSPPWTLIVGGGGLLHPGIDTGIYERAKAQRVILWGVGLNYHDEHPVPLWREMVKPCALVTLRDKVSGVDWCPCPSCLAPEFDSARGDITPTRDVVYFMHYSIPMGFGEPIWDNRRALGRGFKEAVAFLASGRRVITNSYHGAYWAALLGRPVLVYRPFSTRFRSGLTFRDFAQTPEEAAEWLAREVPAPDANYLADCRAVNHKTFRRVQALLEES